MDTGRRRWWLGALRRGALAVDAAVAKACTVAGIAGGGLFFVVAWYIVLDVIGRNYGGFYSGGTVALAGYGLAIGTTWAMAFALRRGAHVSIDVVTNLLPPRVQAALRLVALLVMLVFSTMLARFTWSLAIESYSMGAVSPGILAAPLYIPQTLMAMGLTLLAVEALLMLVVGALGADAVASPAAGGDATAGS